MRLNNIICRACSYPLPRSLLAPTQLIADRAPELTCPSRRSHCLDDMLALSVFLDSLIDYAGLFPPAKLPMVEAVRNHASYLRSARAPFLGRFIVPSARLAEFETAYSQLADDEKSGWRLSLLALPGDWPGQTPGGQLSRSEDCVTDPGQTAASNGKSATVPALAPAAATLLAFNQRHPGARIDAVEAKASLPAEVAAISAAFPASLEMWIEIPSTADPAPLIESIKAAGRGAKIRTGGVTLDAFPPAADIARFLAGCHGAGVVCKATAGLHHPLRAEYRLTDESDSPSGPMFGFLNVFLAATLIHTGGTAAEVTALLVDGQAENFSCAPDALGWRRHRFSADQLSSSRRALCRSFGSCSFTEPLDGLQKLHWL